QRLVDNPLQKTRVDDAIKANQAKRDALQTKLDNPATIDVKTRTDLQQQISTIDLQIAELQKESGRLDTEKASLDTANTSLPTQVSKLNGDLTALRDKMLDAQENAAVAQAKEDRAKEDKFRKEVAAATADPDTYVAANVDSVDPVSQVSISVIGE